MRHSGKSTVGSRTNHPRFDAEDDDDDEEEDTEPDDFTLSFFFCFFLLLDFVWVSVDRPRLRNGFDRVIFSHGGRADDDADEEEEEDEDALILTCPP